MDDQAKRQAISQGNETLSTNAGVFSTLASTRNTVAPNFAPYQGAESQKTPAFLDLMKTMSAAEATAYGIDKDTYAKLKAIANRGGGGGGTPADTSGFDIGSKAP